jgi:hypothetical protein
MQSDSRIAFKEWAVIVDALARGEQTIILRKGGIRETRGEFHVDHREFWLFPTRFHEDELSIIPSKRADFREILSSGKSDSVMVQFYAVAESIVHIADLETLKRLQGRHIWAEQVLAQRFQFGREPGIHALIVRVYQSPQPHVFPLLPEYSGCKSWIELSRAVSTEGLVPVLSDAEFRQQQNALLQILTAHEIAHT